MVDIQGRLIQRESASRESKEYLLRVLYDYHNPDKYSRCAKYVVRLHEDDVLSDIRTKKQQKQKHVPSLLQLCVFLPSRPRI